MVSVRITCCVSRGVASYILIVWGWTMHWRACYIQDEQNMYAGIGYTLAQGLWETVVNLLFFPHTFRENRGMFAYLQNRPTVCSLPTPVFALPLFSELQVHVYICVRHQQNISPPPPPLFWIARERRGNISFATGLGYIHILDDIISCTIWKKQWLFFSWKFY